MRFPLHEVSIVYMGMILGETFELTPSRVHAQQTRGTTSCCRPHRCLSAMESGGRSTQWS